MKQQHLDAIEARITELLDAATLLQRNLNKHEWLLLESTLRYVIAKANGAIGNLHAAQRAWIAEMDAK